MVRDGSLEILWGPPTASRYGEGYFARIGPGRRALRRDARWTVFSLPRFTLRLGMMLTVLNGMALAYGQANGYSLRFFGNGSNDIDRVKIPIDDPATALPGPPIDVGAADFTIEWWMKTSR